MRPSLLEAVDRLAEPRSINFNLHPSLIARLRQAIAHTVVGPGGSSDPAERAPINAIAVDLYRRTEHRVVELSKDWTTDALDIYPEITLRRWLSAFLRARPTEEEIAEHVRMLHGWAAEIERMLNPPITIPVTVPCVRCGSVFYSDERRQTTAAAVVVEYTLAEDDTVHGISTVCRVCSSTWEGAHGANDFTRAAEALQDQATRYEVEIPAERGQSQARAFDQADEAFTAIGVLWGKILLLHSATPEEPTYQFAAWLLEDDHPLGKVRQAREMESATARA